MKMEVHYTLSPEKPGNLPAVKVEEFSPGDPSPHLSRIYPIVPLTSPVFPEGKLAGGRASGSVQTVTEIPADALKLKLPAARRNMFRDGSGGGNEVSYRRGNFRETQQWAQNAPWALYGETPEDSSFQRRYWLVDFSSNK